MNVMEKPVFYYGRSMYRVFSDGDVLTTSPVSFENIRKGDILVFTPPDGKKQVVHRVCGISAGGITTVGDNNSRPDDWLLPPDGEYLLVTGVSGRNGKFCPVRRGRAGMMEFYRNRFRRRMRMLAAKAAKVPPEKIFFRKKLDECHRFGDDVFYYYRGRAVICRKVSGKVIYMKPLDRFFFKIKE